MGATRVGNLLGGFRILECLGSGGAGTIWKAEDLALGRVVALKALRQELAGDDSMAARFRAEARALARLSHANVASLYSLIEDDDGLYLVLEYVEGNTLGALLATSGPLPFDSCFALFHQVLDGVGHAHEAGIVHRDLKPANLMVDARGRVKVMDFGIARMAGVERTTHHGKLVGTPEYMSPEQIRGEDATIRSDLYSLGIVLYEMLAGRPPFRAATSFELMRAQLEEAPIDPCLLRPDLEPCVGEALRRSLAKRPSERFATTRELQDCLLDAGASRRGRTIVPLWQALPAPHSSSEAPTLLTHAPAPDAVMTVPGEPSVQPSEAAGAEPLGAERASAPATEVLDTAPATLALPALPPPTLMLADAPFAVNAGALHSRAVGTALRRGSALGWAAALLTALALAAGAVRLSSRAESAQEPSATAQPAPSAQPEIAPPPAAPEAPPALGLPAPEPTPPKPSAAPRPRPKRSARPAPTPAPEEAPAADASGWVIRR
jgi:serine/threonine-protein kinase